MPVVSAADKALLESGASSIEYYLAVTPLGLVFQASLNDAAAVWGMQTLAYDNVTFGAWGDISAPMTMWVYASDGTTYKGKIRVRGATAASILVMANDDIEWIDNDIIKVYYIYEPWSYPTQMDGSTTPTTYYRDWDLSYPPSGTASAFWPKANAGVAFAHFLNDDGHIDVPFEGSDSFAFAGNTISTYLWDIEDGAFQVGTAATADITARFSETGFRYIKLVVTDSGGLNGQQFVPVWTFGGGYQPLKNFQIRSRSHDLRDGEMTVECFETGLTEEDIFTGAQVVLFSREYIDGTEVSLDTDFGAEFTGRRQIRFVGWILEDTIIWDSETGSVSFSVGTIGKVADRLPGYGTFIKDVETVPISWHEAQGLTVRMAAWQILRWHCNLYELVPMELWDYSSTDPTPDLAGREFSVSPPLKQIESSLLHRRGVFAYLGCSRWSSIHIRTDPQMLHYDERALITIVTELTAADVYTEGRAEKLTRPRLSHIFGGGIAYSGTDATPFRSRAPGLIGRESGRKERAENLIVTSQDNLNELMGRLLGKLSNPWDEMPLESMWDIFEPALQEYVDVNPDVFDNDPRESYPGVDISAGTAWIVRRTQIEDAPFNAPVVSITVERLAKIYLGITVPIPDIPDIPPPPPPPPFLPLFVEGSKLMGWGATYDHVYYTDDFPTPGSGTQPVWNTVTEVGDFDSGDISTFGVDPLRPDYYKYAYFWVSPTVGYISKLDESDTGSGEWEEVLSNTDVQTAGDLFLHADADLSHMKVDPITGYIWSIAYYSTAGYHILGFYKSEDRGATWTLTDTYEDNSNRLNSINGLDAFNDVVVLSVKPVGVHSRIFWTLDGGTTWNNHHLNTPAWGDDILRVGLHPATYDTKVYYYEEYDTDSHANICTFTYATTTRTELLDVHAASGYDAVVNAHPVFWFNYDDEDSMLILIDNFTDGRYYLWVTDDNWATYTEYEPLIDGALVTSQVFYTDPASWQAVVYGGWDLPITPDHLFGGVILLSDETAAGVCGDNPASAPFTNSIPNDETSVWWGSMYFHYSNLLGTNLWTGLYT